MHAVHCGAADGYRSHYPLSYGKASIFDTVAGDALQVFWNSGQIMTFAAEQYIVRQGDRANYCYLLISGFTKITQTSSDGFESLMSFGCPGNLLGCCAVAGTGDYATSVRVVEPSRVIAWNADLFQDLLSRHPIVSRNAMALIHREMLNAHERAEEMRTKSSEQRVAGALLRLIAQRTAHDANWNGVIMLTRQDVADMSGTSLFTVSRTLQTWVRAALVKVGRGQIQVTDPDRLHSVFKRCPGGYAT